MKHFGIILLSLILVRSATALPHTTVGAMTANLDASGRLTIASAHWSTDLLVTVKIDGRIYTNNPSPAGVTRLTDPVFGQLRDTVEVRWSTPDSIDIYLKCSPYDNDLKIEVNFDNRSKTDHVCAAEVLHHYAIDGATAPFLGTDRDYSDIAREIPAPGSNAKPTQMMIIASRNASLDPYTPGFTAASIFYALRLGLDASPDQLYFSVWSSLATVPFGPPTTLPVGCDGGVLLVWNPRTIAASTFTTFVRWLMLPQVNTCSSSDAVIFSASAPLFPAGFHQFWVSAIAYAVNQRGLTNAKLVIKVDSPMTLLTPDFGTTAKFNISTLPRGYVVMTSWMVSSPTAVTESPATHLSIEADNVTPLYRDGCDFIYTPPPLRGYSDLQSPTILSEKGIGYSTGPACNQQKYLVTVYDSLSGNDAPTLNGSNFQISSAPFIPGSDSAFFTVAVIDSSRNGNAQVFYNDRRGNSIERQYTYCTVEDTSAPIVTILPFGDSARVVILDNRPWDRGFNFFSPTAVINVRIDSSTLYKAIDSVSFTIRRFDLSRDGSYCLTATDRAGNTSPVVCWSSKQNGVSSTPTASSFGVFPNPASRTITVDAGSRCDVAIYDVLGTQLVHEERTASVTFDIRALPAGAYIVRVTNGTSTESRRVVVRR